MGVLIDSSVFVEHDRGRLDLQAWVLQANTDSFAISVITLIELYHGLYRAMDAQFEARRCELIESCKRDFVVIPAENRLAETAGRIRANLQRRGLSIGDHDLLIGVTALVRGFDLATANLRDFQRISGLNVLHWHRHPPLSQ